MQKLPFLVTVIILLAVIFTNGVLPTTIYADKIDYKGHYAENSIQNLIDLGIIKGYTDGSLSRKTT